MKKIQHNRYGREEVSSISEWVTQQLRDDGDDYQPHNGIEDRIGRIEDFLGFLTESLVVKGVLDAQAVKDSLDWQCGTKVVEVEENNADG